MRIYSLYMKTSELTILVPVFNGEKILAETLRQFGALLQDPPLPLELLFVDDGSSDASFAMLKTFKREHEQVRVVRLDKNYGLLTALLAGFENARSEVVVVTGMRLEYEITEVFRLYALLTPNVDVVCVRRVGRRDHWWRRFASRLANGIVRLICGFPFRDMNCLLRVCRRTTGLAALEYPSYGYQLSAFWGLRVVETPVFFSMKPKTSSSFSPRS